MKLKTWRTLLGAVVAASFVGISPLAQGKVYPIIYDPQFDGTVYIDIDELTCLGTGLQACNVDLVSAAVFDVTDPSVVYFAGAIANVGSLVLLDGFGIPKQFASDLPNIVVTGDTCDDGCFEDATLQFFINLEPGDPEFPGDATLTFENGTVLSSLYVIGAAIPEPGTLGLLFGALGAGWLAKRRKSAA